MDLPVPAVQTQLFPVQAQDRLSLEQQCARVIAAEVIHDPLQQLYGFDVGTAGGGATYMAALFSDSSHVPPPVPQVEVPITRAAALFAEALDYTSMRAAFNELKSRAAALNPNPMLPLIVCTRITGGGQGGKYLIGVLVDVGIITPPPPGLVARGSSSSSSSSATRREVDEARSAERIATERADALEVRLRALEAKGGAANPITVTREVVPPRESLSEGAPVEPPHPGPHAPPHDDDKHSGRKR